MSVSKWRYTEECNGRPCPGDCDHCSFEPTDLISRADAIEAVQKVVLDAEAIEALKALPSADAYAEAGAVNIEEISPEEFDTIAESGERIKGWEYI